MDANEIARLLFTHHIPNVDQMPRVSAIREKAKELAHAIAENTPRGASQMAAIRKLRHCVMNANAAIALEE
jgi:hypothetical protein